MRNKDKALWLLVVLVVLVAAVLIGCGGGDVGQRNTAGTRYRVEVFEGMPCLIYSGARRGGITCDWTKYTGPALGD